MSFGQFFNQWWNVPYLVLLGLVGVYFALQAVGLSGALGGHDGDADHDLGHDAEVAHEADHEQDELGTGGTLASFVGLGRVPFLVVWLTLFLCTGFTGLFVNLLLVSLGPFRPLWLLPSLLASLTTGLLATRLVARAVHRLVDVGGRGSIRKHELVGAPGTVASPLVDAKFGEIRVRDGRGLEILVHGRIEEGEADLRRGERVVLIDYDAASGLFRVAALHELEAGSKGRIV